MATACTITISNNLGAAASLEREARGYPDGRDGVLNTLRAGLTATTETRPESFDVRAFRHSLWTKWSAAGFPVTAVATPVGADRRRVAFHYDVLPTYHHEPTLFVRVSALEEPTDGIGLHSFVPVGAFLLFPARVRAVHLSTPDRLAAKDRHAFAGLVARVDEARESAGEMLGDALGASAEAGLACLRLGDWLAAGDRADREAIAAFHERGQRAVRRAGRLGGRRDPARGMVRTYNAPVGG